MTEVKSTSLEKGGTGRKIIIKFDSPSWAQKLFPRVFKFKMVYIKE